MKFTGEIRIPEVDHPGVPATILIDDSQIEVVLDGESLGRWSLFDVHARRLVASAFQIDLEGEEVTFIADEPIDFAYRGVEHMAEAWARLKQMKAPRRMFAVRKSRQGLSSSRVQELRSAMEANLQVQKKGVLSQPPPPEEPRGPQHITSPETHVTEPEPVSPSVGETTGDEMAKLEADIIENRRLESQRAEAARIEEARVQLEMDWASLQEERAELGRLRAEAEERDVKRIEAFRLEMARLETERAEHERLEAERAEIHRVEMERLAAERERIELLEAERQALADQDAERSEVLAAEMVRLEATRIEMERLEAERLEKARVDLDAVEARRQELERLEVQRAEAERLELTRLEAERAEARRLEAEKAESERLEAERVEAERAEVERLQAERLEAERLEAERAEAETARSDLVHEVLRTSADGDDESAKELVVDLGVYESDGHEPEPALAAAREKAGFMGAVRSAFSRNGKNHDHQFVEAPGGIGIVRSICRDCGYVSISAED